MARRSGAFCGDCVVARAKQLGRGAGSAILSATLVWPKKKLDLQAICPLALPPKHKAYKDDAGIQRMMGISSSGTCLTLGDFVEAIGIYHRVSGLGFRAAEF